MSSTQDAPSSDPALSPPVGIVDEDDWYEEPARPRWPWISGLVLCLLGFGVAAYLTYEHYTGSTSLSCPAGSAHGGAIDCLKVTTSVYSVKYGIPVAVLGLVYFAVMAVLQSPWAWRSPLLAVRAARIVWCLVGIGTALQLVYDELYRIDAICLWCTAVHILTLFLLFTTVFGTLAVTSARMAAAE